MARRYELSDEQYALIEDLLPLGGGWTEHRQILNGMFWKLGSGAAWRDIPERYGPWQTVYDRFRRWSDSGLFKRILRRLRLRLREDGDLDLSTWYADSTVVRSHKAAAGAKKGEKPSSATPKAASAPKSTSCAKPAASPSPRA
jgi:transposase